MVRNACDKIPFSQIIFWQSALNDIFFLSLATPDIFKGQ